MSCSVVAFQGVNVECRICRLAVAPSALPVPENLTDFKVLFLATEVLQSVPKLLKVHETNGYLCITPSIIFRTSEYATWVSASADIRHHQQ